MSLSIKEIKENYSQFPDYKIEQIAKTNASTLNPEVIEVLKGEIRKRNLNSNLLEAVNAQVKSISKKEMSEIKNLIKSCECPSCASSEEKLKAMIVADTASMFILTFNNERLFIGCLKCIKKEVSNAIVKTILFGWWSPWGMFYFAPKTLMKNYSNSKNYIEVSEALLESFVVENIGTIKTMQS
ncbi:MAG: hypothetical protein JKX98_06785, partial [Alcanivoracaceae bacterium]|nr:hypothetical protein [Alcanivoracaceae bacterium]